MRAALTGLIDYIEFTQQNANKTTASFVMAKFRSSDYTEWLSVGSIAAIPSSVSCHHEIEILLCWLSHALQILLICTMIQIIYSLLRGCAFA